MLTPASTTPVSPPASTRPKNMKPSSSCIKSEKDDERKLYMTPASSAPLPPSSIRSINEKERTEQSSKAQDADAPLPDDSMPDDSMRDNSMQSTIASIDEARVDGDMLLTTAIMTRRTPNARAAKQVTRQPADTIAEEDGSIRPGAYHVARYNYFDDNNTSELNDHVFRSQSTFRGEASAECLRVQDRQALQDSQLVCEEFGATTGTKCWESVMRRKWLLVLLSVLIILATAGLIGGVMIGLNNKGDTGKEVLYDFPTTVPTAAPSRWNPWQEAESIVGLNASVSFGASVALSGDGQIMAAGSIGSDLVYGRVQAYQRRSTNNDSWVTLGQPLESEVYADSWGLRVALSRDGTTLALSAYERGLVKVFSLEGSQWLQRGSDLFSENTNSRFGWSLDISPNGNVLAVGDIRDDASDFGTIRPGAVSVFNWNGTSWVQQGATVVGEEDLDRFGHFVSLSRDSSRIAIGILRLEMVVVYQYDISNSTWVKVGSEISAGGNHTSSIRFGSEGSLASEGNVVAIGAPYTDLNGTDAGSIHLFSWDGASWKQRGSPITGEYNCDYVGRENTMRLSEDGSVLCAASRSTTSQRACGPAIPGFVRVFKWDGDTWTQRGYDVDGVHWDDKFGGSIAMSEDGLIFVVGAPMSDINGADSGRVQVYQFEDPPK